MIHIAIVEDERTYADTLREYLDRYATEHGCRFAVTAYPDGEDIVRNYHADSDIILMDIEMRSMDGMTAAKRIRESDDSVIIMFITYTEADGLSFDASAMGVTKTVKMTKL